MLGRGGESNYHDGNLTFRSFIQDRKKRYQEARKQDKPIIALEVVLAWRELSPPGRFLARIDSSRADSLWYDVGDDAACKRAGRTLGERSAPKASASNSSIQESEKKKDPTSHLLDYLVAEGGPDRIPQKVSSSSSLKRRSGSRDFIASLTSSSLPNSDGIATPWIHQERNGNERLQPSKKKFKTVTSQSAKSPPVGAAASFLHDFDLRQKVSSLVTTNKVSNDCCLNKFYPSKVSNRDSPGPQLPLVDDIKGCMQLHEMAMQDDVPTAEFLTQTVFFD